MWKNLLSLSVLNAMIQYKFMTFSHSQVIGLCKLQDKYTIFMINIDITMNSQRSMVTLNQCFSLPSNYTIYMSLE